MTNELDPRRWVTLGIVTVAALIVVLDNTVLTVAIPTILRDLHTDLPSLQWVLTGYSLTFATLLIIGGRLGDIFGSRRMFIIGAALFGIGSLIASESTSVPMLLAGEAVIEGIGASLMMPATLSILSTTFAGHARAKAFAFWGATAGVAVAFGPVVGGFLTTNYSWRWAFRINVIVAPLAVLGALLFMHRTARSERRQRIDIPGALLIAASTFLLVFALSEGGIYGWLRPLQDFSVAGVLVWPASRPISIIPPLLALALVILAAFIALERAKERAEKDPLFELSHLEHRTFRYGLMTLAVLAMGQLGQIFVLPVLLQDGQHLTAIETGVWMVPSGVAIALGAPLGGRLTRRFNVTRIVRMGLLLETAGLAALTFVIDANVTFVALLPGLLLFGVGVGFASSQLTNIVLSEIPKEHAGAASGANTTVRQMGAALGIATIGSLLSTQMLRHATSAIGSSSLPADAKATALEQLRARGVGFVPPPQLAHAIEDAVAAGARPALLFAVIVVALGAALSFLIPPVAIEAQPSTAVTSLEAYEAIDVDPALID